MLIPKSAFLSSQDFEKKAMFKKFSGAGVWFLLLGAMDKKHNLKGD